MLFVQGESCPVALFKSFVGRRPLLKHPCDGLLFSTSVANETENLNLWFKLNQWAKVIKVTAAGTSLKESEKKVYQSLCKKNNSQQAEESKDCKFRIYA